MFFGLIDKANLIVTSIGALAGFVAMAALFLAGLAEIGWGSFEFLTHIGTRAENPNYPDMISRVIHGVELLLLAPVAFLIFTSLNGYLVKHPDPETAQAAHSELLRVKSFVMGLLFALIATSVVGQILKGELTPMDALSVGGIMAVIGLYFFALERLAIARRN